MRTSRKCLARISVSGLTSRRAVSRAAVAVGRKVLLELDDNRDLVNQVLEVTAEDDETLRILRYALRKE